MIRILTQFAVNLVSSVIAFLVADLLLDDFTLQTSGFIIAVVVFTLAQTILGPFVFNMARQHASAILGGIGIVSTLLALIITSLISDAMSINGFGTWFLAALIVWLITALGSWILLAILAKRAKARSDAAQEQDLINKIQKNTKGTGAGA